MRTGFVGAATAALLVLLAGAPVQAQNDSPCPAGQPPGRQPGQPAEEPQEERGQYPIGECQLRLSQSIAEQGETIQAAGNGYAPGSAVNLSLNGTGVASATADGNGAFSADVRVPADAALGRGVVTAEGVDSSSGSRVLSANLTVVEAGGVAAPASAAPADSGGISRMLPRTGAGIAALTATGAGFIAIGTAAVVAARRRRAATA